VPVARHEIEQSGQPVERRVGRKQQHERGRCLHEAVEDAAADRVMRKLRQHRLVGTGTTASSLVSATTPANIVTRRKIIQLSEARALRQATGLKAGTALDIASIPVIAVAPEEKARSKSRASSVSVACTAGGRGIEKPCAAESTMPTITIM